MGLPRVGPPAGMEDMLIVKDASKAKQPDEQSPGEIMLSSPLDFAGLDAFCLPTCGDEDVDFTPRLREMLDRRSMDWSALPPENDLGCIEYKWRLGAGHNRNRLDRLATQMRFRLGEGGGTAYYLIGVRDSGSAPGLLPQEHAASVRVLMEAAAVVGSACLLEAISEARPVAGGGDARRCSVWRVGARLPTLAQVINALDLGGIKRAEGCRAAATRLEGRAAADNTRDRLGLAA
mmetsp:Transcript_11188/g.20364  ORF Transcript_11188/g.20364 Transcript_11188/m.20364 type:complete len:234 (+) Transcript_11188:64-765(+)